MRDVKIEAAEDRLNLRASRIKQLKSKLAKSRATASRLEKANKERIRQLVDDKNALENEKKTLEHDKKTLEEDKMALEDQLSKSEAQNLVLKRKWEKGILSLRTVLERNFSGKNTCYCY